jgi:hypothetical protein
MSNGLIAGLFAGIIFSLVLFLYAYSKLSGF